MGGIFGTITKKSCVADVFYGTDYNSHLGTRRGGLAMYSKEKGFVRSIHNLESSYFRTKFEPTLDRFKGCTAGIGVISDTDAQPLVINSHLGQFAICTVAKIANRPRCEFITSGCASVSLITPIPAVLPSNRSSVGSNLERKYEFSRLWMERTNPFSLLYIAKPPRRVPRCEL